MGGMLPNLAGSATTDDVQEFGIKVVSANNTTFTQGDYILFMRMTNQRNGLIIQLQNV